MAGLGQTDETLDGAGAIFPCSIYAKWAEACKAETGTSFNYRSIDSGGGIKKIKATTVDLGASYMPSRSEGDRRHQDHRHGVVLTYIPLGKITTWNDAPSRGSTRV